MNFVIRKGGLALWDYFLDFYRLRNSNMLNQVKQTTKYRLSFTYIP